MLMFYALAGGELAMRNHMKVTIALISAIALIVSLIALSGCTKRYTTRLHVLPIAYGDALIIESNGVFGIVDSGESWDYPDGSDPRYPAREGITKGDGVEEMLFPLLDELGVSAQKGNLQFYIGTHPHSDHIGTASQVIEKYRPKYVYTPRYDDSMLPEDARWDNQYVYDRLIAAAHSTGATLIQDFDISADAFPQAGEDGTAVGNPTFPLGNATVSILGFAKSETMPEGGFADANDISYEVLFENDKYRTFLAGDVVKYGPSEQIIAETVGKVDVLKLGHHGNDNAGSKDFILALSPEFAIQTGSDYALSGETTRALMDVKAKYYPTSEAADLRLNDLMFTYYNTGIEANMKPYELGQWG